MTTIKIGGKTLTVSDGCDLEIDGDAITVKPSSAPQPVYVPIYQPWGPWNPIYPQPFNVESNTSGGFPFPLRDTIITCRTGQAGAELGNTVSDGNAATVAGLPNNGGFVGSTYFARADDQVTFTGAVANPMTTQGRILIVAIFAVTYFFGDAHPGAALCVIITALASFELGRQEGRRHPEPMNAFEEEIQ